MASYKSYRFKHSQALMPDALAKYQIDVLCALRWWTRRLRPFLPALEGNHPESSHSRRQAA